MIQNLEQLEAATVESSEILCRNVFGYSSDAFSGQVDFIAEYYRDIDEVPALTRTRKGARLALSLAGANFWQEVIGPGCEAVGITPDYVYTASGIALLELANVTSYAASYDDAVARLRRVDKTFQEDINAQKVSSRLAEHTNIGFSSIAEGLDQDDNTTISKLRYGIGVALKGLDFRPEQTAQFAQVNFEHAVSAIRRYRDGIVWFLNDAIFRNELQAGDLSSEEVAAGIYRSEFPFVQVASSMPMNVEYLLNK